MFSAGSTMDLIQSSLQASSLSQKVYADNIANANTPGYQAKDVVFQGLVNQAMSPAPVPTLNLGQATVSLTIPVNNGSVQPVIETTGGTMTANNGNNVSMEAQMVGMATNQLRYNALSQDIVMRFQRMKQVLTGV